LVGGQDITLIGGGKTGYMARSGSYSRPGALRIYLIGGKKTSKRLPGKILSNGPIASDLQKKAGSARGYGGGRGLPGDIFSGAQTKLFKRGLKNDRR